MPVVIGGSGPVTGVTSINTTVSDTELGYLDGVTSAIQTQINAKANDSSQGLYLITSAAFTSVSSVNINNCFTSTYRNYKLIMSADASAGIEIRFRMRVGGVDASGATDYKTGWAASTSGAAEDFSSFASAGRNTGFLSYSNGADFHGINHTFYQPQIAASTYVVGTLVTTQLGQGTSGTQHTPATSYDGVSLLASSGTMTGFYRIYGMKD